MSMDSPTQEELAVHRLALKDAEGRGDLATVTFGKYPGWFYRQPFDEGCPFGWPVDDVYLYSPEHIARFKVSGLFGDVGAVARIGRGSDLFYVVHGAFEHGANFVEIRPMKELEL